MKLKDKLKLKLLDKKNNLLTRWKSWRQRRSMRKKLQKLEKQNEYQLARIKRIRERIGFEIFLRRCPDTDILEAWADLDIKEARDSQDSTHLINNLETLQEKYKEQYKDPSLYTGEYVWSYYFKVLTDLEWEAMCNEINLLSSIYNTRDGVRLVKDYLNNIKRDLREQLFPLLTKSELLLFPS